MIDTHTRKNMPLENRFLYSETKSLATGTWFLISETEKMTSGNENMIERPEN